MKQKEIAKLSALIFAIVAILHLFRSVLQWPLVVSDYSIPTGVSVIAVIVLAYLAYQNWKVAK